MSTGRPHEYEDSFTTWAERPWGRAWEVDSVSVKGAEAITEIGLSRGMCYGMCPVYSVRLHRRGRARFDGEYFVALIGGHEAAIDPDVVTDLAHALVYLRYEALAPSYSSPVTDNATVMTWLVRGGVRHEVSDYAKSGPQALDTIEELIDAVVAGLDWQALPTEPRANDGTSIFVGSTLNPDDLPFVDDASAHWTQRRRTKP